MNLRNSRLIFAGHYTGIAHSLNLNQRLVQFRFVVCRHDLSERSAAVLDRTRVGQDPLAATRRDARGVEHLHAVFSGAAAGRIFLRPPYNFVDSSSQASAAAQRRPAALDALLA